MSIILEALKKVGGQQPVVYTENKRQVQISEIKSEKNKDGADNKINLIFIVPALVFAGIFITGVISLSLIFKTKDPAYPEIQNRLATPKAATAHTLNFLAEGYTPSAHTPEQVYRKISSNNIFKPKNSFPSLKLNGIVSGIGEPTAIIEDKIVKEGESIKGVKILKIHSDKVEASSEISGEVFTLNLH